MNYRIFTLRNKFIRHTGGATAIEYALIAAGVAVAIAAVVYVTGADVAALFDAVNSVFAGV